MIPHHYNLNESDRNSRCRLEGGGEEAATERRRAFTDNDDSDGVTRPGTDSPAEGHAWHDGSA